LTYNGVFLFTVIILVLRDCRLLSELFSIRYFCVQSPGDHTAMSKSINSMQSRRFTGQIAIVFAYQVVFRIYYMFIQII